jgi:hypothetical protein
MIITFPMLVSQSVSENVIPGIVKTVEGYLIVNHMSEIMDNPEIKGTGILKGFRSTKKAWFAREGIELLEISDKEREEILGKGGTKVSSADDEEKIRKQAIEKEKLERERRKEEREKQEEEKKRNEERLKQRETKATAKISIGDYKSVSLEPSYITVEVSLRSGATRREFVGIKVIPYRVTSSEKLSRLILHDSQLTSLNALMISFGRKVMRWFYSFIDKWMGRIKAGVTMSGDPRRDIIMARTGKEGLGIVVLDKNEDVDERFLNNISKINRLFKLGWGNIIVADDITRNAYFCMRRFSGTCQVLSYPMMYQNLGQLKVYESIDDAKRQNSSLFKVSVRASKVFSEWKTEDKLFKYYISEDK